MGFTAKEIGRNILSVLGGLLYALIIIIPIGLFVGVLSFSDSAVPKTQIVVLDTILIGSIMAGCLTGGYTTASIAKKEKLISSLFTGVILTFLYAITNDFEFNIKYLELGIAYFGFIPTVLVGALIKIKKK